MDRTSELLQVQGLRVVFRTEDGDVLPAVDGVSFELAAGQTLGIVGESGSGKSVTALSIMGLIPQPPGRIAAGSILFQGEDLLGKKPQELRAIRGRDISMIFQEPMTSLNPVFTVGDQIMEALLFHKKGSRAEARQRALKMLGLVGIPSPERRFHEYPHQLSGGMRQRVMIAIALACDPKLLIADEPTTALDVTIQAQILELMKTLRRELGMAIMLITHDMGVIAEMADQVVVMYAGKVVERAVVAELFSGPKHPYTIGLLGSIPRMHHRVERLTAIEGVVPSPQEMPKGCRFHTRCKYRREDCADREPPLVEVSPGHWAACWNCLDHDGSK